MDNQHQQSTTYSNQSVPNEMAARIKVSNNWKIIVAILCFTLPVMMIVIGGIVGVLSYAASVRYFVSHDPSDITPGIIVIGKFALTLFTVGVAVFIPSVAAGVILLIKRRKIIPNATN